MSGETVLQRAIIDALAQVYGVAAIRVQSGRVRARGGYVHAAPPGTPDLLLEMFRTSMLEIKTSSGRLSLVQENRHAELEQRGVRIAVVRSVAGALEVVQRWREQDRELERMVREREALERSGLA